MTTQPNEEAYKAFEEYKTLCEMQDNPVARMDFTEGFKRGIAGRDPEVAELKKLIELLGAQSQELQGIIKSERVVREKAEVACVEMRELLKSHGFHLGTCKGWYEADDVGPLQFNEKDCSCGLNQALSSCGESVLRRLEILDQLLNGDWLVWSNEHRAYWRPNRCGYCEYIEGAGRYKFHEAMECASARSRDLIPPEVIVPSPELISCYKAAQPKQEGNK